MVPVAVYANLFIKWELTMCNAFSMLSVTCPSPPSLPPETAWRGWQPHGITCYIVATGFLYSVDPQAPLPVGYPVNYASCISSHSVCDSSDATTLFKWSWFRSTAHNNPWPSNYLVMCMHSTINNISCYIVIIYKMWWQESLKMPPWLICCLPT